MLVCDRLQNAVFAFGVLVQQGYAVAVLEEEHLELMMRTVKSRDGSSVLVPKDEMSYLTLNTPASDPSTTVHLMKLDPATQVTKCVLMGSPLRITLSLLL